VIGRLAAIALAFWSAMANAHRPSDAFVMLTLNGEAISGQWEIAVRDIEAAFGVDANRDSSITWGEVRAAQDKIISQLTPALRIRGDDIECRLAVTELLINDRLDGRFAWFSLAGTCPRAPSALGIDYHFLFELDPSHRAIVVVHSGQSSQTAVLGPAQPTVTLQLGRASGWREFREYVVEGIRHIWTGFDHILFLLALLLPAVLVREKGRWKPLPRLAPVLIAVLGIVTAFTLAHSITLSLAALDILRLPSRWVETAIAASVFISAMNNLTPVVTRSQWVMACGFGLIHGFGFASALSELGLPSGSRLLCLVGFNLGVEIGQLAIVLAAIPVAYRLRDMVFYRVGILAGGSAAVAATAALWFGQRAF
jgi:hypothetical protein